MYQNLIGFPIGRSSFRPELYPGAVFEFGSHHGSGWAYQDTARTTLATANADVIKSITNYANASFHWEQATTANAGTLAKSAYARFDGVLLDGVSDRLISGSTNTYNSATGAFSVISVLYSSPENTGNRYTSLLESLTAGDYDNNNSVPLGRNLGSFRAEHTVLAVNPGSVTVAGGGAGVVNIIVYRIDAPGGTHNLYVSGVTASDTFTSHASFLPNYNALGCGVDPVLMGVSYFGNYGMLAQLGINRLITDAERDYIVAGYKGLYGIP